MKKIFLYFALALGLFPGSGLFGAKSALQLKCKRLSFPSIYSYFTLLLRISSINVAVSRVWSVVAFIVVRKVEEYTLLAGFVTIFCTGGIYQIISLWRAKKFILLLQKIEEYDSQYPKKKSLKRHYSTFTIYNIVFEIFVILFPVLVVFSLWQFGSNMYSDLKVPLPKIDWLEVGPQIGFLSICLLISEAATIYPIIQIGYFIKALQHRFQEILDLVLSQVRPNTPMQYDLLSKIYEIKTWANKRTHSFNKLGNRVPSSNYTDFWKRLNHRYLNFMTMMDTFMQYSGIFFIAIFPLQIISSVCIFYYTCASDIFVAQAIDPFIIGVLVLGLIKLAALCNIGHQIEKTHSLILMESLRVDADDIQDYNERAEYEKFGHMVRSIPVQLNASGYFNVGRSNVPSIITALVSYIIVLLQFRGSEVGQKVLANFTLPNSTKSVST